MAAISPGITPQASIPGFSPAPGSGAAPAFPNFSETTPAPAAAPAPQPSAAGPGNLSLLA